MSTIHFVDSPFTILIGGSPSNALLVDPKQALQEELGRLVFTALHLMAWKFGIEMIVYLKTQIAFPRTIYTMDLKLLRLIGTNLFDKIE